MPSCSDCKVSLEPIRIVDATDYGGFSGEGGRHVDLCYAPISADAGWFTGTVKGTLKINGMICPHCRRISMYG
jgi:hypothetical protein